MGINKFRKEAADIMAATKEKIKADKKDPKHAQGIKMMEQMVSAICNYVEKEAGSNTSFAEALGYEWKSAERMLKSVWDNAREMSVQTPAGMGCCVADDVVYDWVNEYYAKDDKAEVEAEIKKEAERKAKAEAEKVLDAGLEAEAREKAVAILSKDEGFLLKTDGEKEALIKKEASKIKSRLKAAAKKKAEKESRAEFINAATDKGVDTTPAGPAIDTEDTDSAGAARAGKKPGDSAGPAPSGKNGQFTLFDLFM